MMTGGSPISGNHHIEVPMGSSSLGNPQVTMAQSLYVKVVLDDLGGTPWIGKPHINRMNHGKGRRLANKFTNYFCFVKHHETSFLFGTGNYPKPVWTLKNILLRPPPSNTGAVPEALSTHTSAESLIFSGTLGNLYSEVVQTSTFVWVFITGIVWNCWIGPTSLWIKRSIICCLFITNYD